MFPALTRVHTAQSNIQVLEPVSVCDVAEEGAKPVHTQLNLATVRHHEGSMVETRRPNHDEVQAVTAITRLRRKRVEKVSTPVHKEL
jgi:hypothetical protein